MSVQHLLLLFCCYYSVTDNVSVMLRQVFESHQASNPVEDLFKSAASGDITRVEEVRRGRVCIFIICIIV